MTVPLRLTPPLGEERTVGRYVLYDSIASGGMATLHLGRLLGPVGFSRTVAIKRLHPEFARNPEFVTMFVDEARLAARIHHPNVVPTLDVVSLESELFLVMEYVPGEALSRILRTLAHGRERMSPRLAVSLVAGMLHGLHAAHEARDEQGRPLGIVHRDVSPHNVLVGTDGTTRLLDFGVAKAAGRLQTTRHGQLKGKTPYMAPEQVRHGIVHRQTDIYAATAVLWEALTSRRLISGQNHESILSRVLSHEIAPPSDYAQGLPPELDAITLRGLSSDPAKRFSTARQMALALEACTGVFTPLEIGQWLEGVAAPALAERAAKLAAIERRPCATSYQTPAGPLRAQRTPPGTTGESAQFPEVSAPVEPPTTRRPSAREDQPTRVDRAVPTPSTPARAAASGLAGGPVASSDESPAVAAPPAGSPSPLVVPLTSFSRRVLARRRGQVSIAFAAGSFLLMSAVVWHSTRRATVPLRMIDPSAAGVPIGMVPAGAERTSAPATLVTHEAVPNPTAAAPVRSVDPSLLPPDQGKSPKGRPTKPVRQVRRTR